MKADRVVVYGVVHELNDGHMREKNHEADEGNPAHHRARLLVSQAGVAAVMTEHTSLFGESRIAEGTVGING